MVCVCVCVCGGGGFGVWGGRCLYIFMCVGGWVWGVGVYVCIHVGGWVEKRKGVIKGGGVMEKATNCNTKHPQNTHKTPTITNQKTKMAHTRTYTHTNTYL